MKHLIIVEEEPLISFNRVKNLVFLKPDGSLAIWNDRLKEQIANTFKGLKIPFTYTSDGIKVKVEEDYHCKCNVDPSNKYDEICITKGRTTCRTATTEEFMAFMYEANK